jgi:hypothetical protein
MGSEAGNTYTLRIYDQSGPALMHTESRVTAASWTYNQAVRQADFGGIAPHHVTIEIESVRDGLTSRYAQSIDLTVNDS